MHPSRYKTARTLVRRLCRLPGEDRSAFRSKVGLLRGHFEQFNVDVSELCQWLMSLRKRNKVPENPATFGALGDFLLQPGLPGEETDEKEADRLRLAVFDAVAGFRMLEDRLAASIPASLSDAIRDEAVFLAGVRAAGKPSGLARVLARLEACAPAQRLVLLKSAAEWIVARFLRGTENWMRQRAEWEKEKAAWEAAHPHLTPEVRAQFNKIFESLHDPENSGKPGVSRKNPRICPWDRLKQNLDNCCYGEKGHSALCWRYQDFLKQRMGENRRDKKNFSATAMDLAQICREWKIQHSRNALNNPRVLDRLFAEHERRKQDKTKKESRSPKPRQGGYKANPKADYLRSFKAHWKAYLEHMKLNDTTVLERGCLPHCLSIKKNGKESTCKWNKHTELCLEYKRSLAPLPDSVLELEPEYREWRRLYLHGPGRPHFRYPSAGELPLPKVFGEGFHQVDLDRSIVRLRLEGAAEGEWLEFGFIPWPRGYQPSRREVLITSVQVHFVGTRPRAGFRFDVSHRTSRFGCSQDELDELRSRRYPRQAQDKEFLAAARAQLIQTFEGGEGAARQQMRVMSVDLGEGGACASIYEGRTHQKDESLKVIKIDRRYDQHPEVLEKDVGAAKPQKFEKSDPRGVRKEHVARHLNRIAAGASAIAEHRRKERSDAECSVGELQEHDFRSLKRHIAWMIRDWVRLNAAQIIDVAKQHCCDLIVFESQRGFRLPGYDELDRGKKQRFAILAFGRIRRKVVEKAVEHGMRVVTVPYFASSQVCSACKRVQENRGSWRENKKKRVFACEFCKLKLNSDANASRVLARVFWGEIELPEPTRAHLPSKA